MLTSVASADRRPVDPPPVVELHIYQLKDGEPPKDITFGYEANFFLFATLENARPIAHGRGQPPTASVPVLTGMPVSGMAYLDRPQEAGYFIFPDLSVRHEGRYKLSFNLYEQTMHDKDASAEPSDSQHMPAGSSPDSSFDWRLEVKSDPFIVYSAKKFPGLAESTMLSRTVAEQGCRVRIRRDVRMRRRDGKMGNQDYEDDMAYERPVPAHSSYDAMNERNRSLSGSPVDGRRGSGELPAAGGHLNFGHGEGYAQQYAPPPATFAQPPHPAHQPPYHPSGPAPFQQAAPEYRPQPPPVPQSTHYPYTERSYPQSAHPSTNPHDFPREEFRRASDASYASASYAPASKPAFDPIPRASYSGYPSMDGPRLPSLKLDSRFDSSPSTTGPVPLSRIVSTVPPVVPERHQTAYPTPAPGIMASDAPAPRKRLFDQGFPNSAARQYEPLHNHQRPEITHPSQALVDDEVENSTSLTPMSYKRADGVLQSRPCPEIMP